MLKEIKRSQVLDLMAEGVPVFMLYRVDMGHTIEDVLGADGYLIDVPEEADEEDPEEEPCNEVNEVVNEVAVEVKDKSSEKRIRGGSQKRELPAEKTEKIIQMFKEGKSYNQISLYTGIGIGIVKRIVKEHDPEAAKAHAAGRGRKPGCEYNVPPKDERIDLGKIGALAKAGWNPEKIAYDMGIDLSAVNEVLNAERVDS